MCKIWNIDVIYTLPLPHYNDFPGDRWQESCFHFITKGDIKNCVNRNNINFSDGTNYASNSDS